MSLETLIVGEIIGGLSDKERKIVLTVGSLNGWSSIYEISRACNLSILRGEMDVLVKCGLVRHDQRSIFFILTSLGQLVRTQLESMSEST